MITEMKIKSFLAVATTRNFTGAGRLLYTSQQAVSKNVLDLERDVGVPLLNRSHHNVSLTPEGELLYAFFEKTLRAFDTLVADFRTGTPIGTISDIHIGYQDLLNFGSAPGRALKRLRETAPNILSVGERSTPSNLLKMIDRKAVDIILINKRFLPRKNPGMHILPLINSTMVVGVCADHPLIRENGTYRDFSEETLLIDAIEGETESAAIRRASVEIHRFDFKPRKIIVLPNRETIYSEAELGRGIFFASGIALIPNSDRLKIYTTDMKETTCCVWRKDENTELIARFAQYLKEEYTDNQNNLPQNTV
jgi:DNA-binding transcriptional LysR family regulator